ncbi:hypothetical protein [Sediminicola sp. 1XM1-17]|uniref:hypothetical protein n=1 Tax=Sediminicola sp. 1XM1-17 TaxID=3127702 RepID=UPI0030788EC9
MKISVFTLFLFALFLGNAQTDLNQYKYIIVPKKFDGFRNENQYKTSTLIKYLFTENGFNPVYEDALPDDLNRNRCLGLLVGLKDESGMFTTKLSLILSDCNSKVVMQTREGISKEKDYITAYDEAIRDAFISLQGTNYAYAPSDDQKGTVKVSFNNDVKQLNEKGTNMSENKDLEQGAGAVADYQPANAGVNETSAQAEEAPSLEGNKVGFLSKLVLYAQELTNGYQLVDKTPKIVLKMLKSSMADVFIAEAGDQDGLVYRKDGKWYFEYTSNGKVMVEELQIRF